MLATVGIFLFEGFRPDRQSDGLSRRDAHGVFVPIAVGLRALDVLLVLVERPGRLVTKEEIMAAVWGRTVVENANLTVQIAALRRVLDQGRSEASAIQIVAARGYRFLPTVTAGQPALRRERSGGSRSVPPLSIVVLPFANLSSDPEQRYFADGITDDLTTDLSRIENAFVISRNTAFTYMDKPVDAKQIGRELGVRYVLEGSVRRSGDQIRVNAQLIDAETAAHIWAERFDRTAGGLFALQDEITSRIAVALDLELVAAEAGRPIEHPDALDHVLRGRAVFLKPRTLDTYRAAIHSFERALTLDPQSADAQSRLAGVLVTRVLCLVSDSATADLAHAEALVNQALAASPRSAHAHLVKGHVLRARSRWGEAIPEYEAALALNQNLLAALSNLGWCKLYAGSIEEVIPLVDQAIRLSPGDPGSGLWYYLIGTVHLLQSHTDEAIFWLQKARNALPTLPSPRGALTSAYALKSETERAAAELAEVRTLNGGHIFSSIAHVKALPFGAWWGATKTRAMYEATYFAGLRKAGMPEE